MDQDTRISRLARNLARAEAPETFCSICKQIIELLDISENRRYLARSFNCLIPSLESSFKLLSGCKWPDAGVEYAKLLGKIANSIDVTTVKFFPWIFDMFEKGSAEEGSWDISSSVQDVFFTMITLLEPERCNVLLASIHDVLVKEKVQSSDAFKALCSAFVKVLDQGASCETKSFQEFTDVVIGWMVDENQNENKTYMFCSEILMKLEAYFAYDAVFTSQLLVQILDDLEDSILELQTNQDLKKLTRIFFLVKAYSSITSVSSHLDSSYLKMSVERFISTVIKLMFISSFDETEDFFVYKTKRKVFQQTLEHLIHMDHTASSAARMLIKEILQECLANVESGERIFIPLKDVSHGVSAWMQSVASLSSIDDESMEIVDLTLQLLDGEFEAISEEEDPLSVLSCIHSFLRSRCVVVLQKVYSWLVQKCQILSPSEGIAEQKTVCTVITALCDIASCKANSILTRWALEPPIFDVLMIIYNRVEDKETQFTVLKLLKAHCLAQSHFVSSAFSQFSADSPGPSHMFLHNILDFWIEILRTDENHTGKWILHWVLVFLKTSTAYSAVLADSCSHFFINLISLLSDKPYWYLQYAKILHFLTSEPAYENTVVYSVARDAAVEMLTKAKEMTKETRLELLKIFEDLCEITVFESGFKEGFLNVSGAVDSPISDTSSLLCAQVESSDSVMTPTEFDEFISHLITVETPGDNPWVLPEYSKKTTAAAVDVLIRSKLKSPLGKPPDLFSQLQTLFKKHRSVKSECRIPSWKLDFVYQLDTEIHIAMQESLTNRTTLPDSIKNFYTTNRIPCSEWLKRLRLDVGEVALQTGNYTLAFLYASSAGDEPRVKRAAFGLKDSDTLKSLNETALSHYIAGRFEDSMKGMEDVSPETENEMDEVDEDEKISLEEINAAVCEALSTLACKSLQDWSEKDTIPPNRTKDFKVTELFLPPQLSLQSSSIPEILSNSILDHGKERKKSSLLIVGKEDQVLDIHTVLRLADHLKDTSSNNVAPELHERILVLKMKGLLERKNKKLVRSLLAEQKIVSLFGDTPCLVDFNLHCLRSQADLLFVENQVDKSASIYSAISALLENAHPEEFKCFRNDFVLSYTKKLEKDERFAAAVLENLQLDSSSLSGIHNIIQSEYSKYLSSPDQDEDCWFAFGSYMYNLPESENGQLMTETKEKALDAFCQYLMLCSNKVSLKKLPSLRTCAKKSPTLITAMIRVLELFREGYQVDPERIFVHEEWLTLLPSLSGMETMQGALFRRFPKQVGFHIASQQAQKKDHFKICIKDRKTMFDPDSYGFYEYSEDSPSRSKPLGDYRFPVDPQTGIRTSKEDYEPDLELPREIKTVFRELQRIGSSREDQWVSAYHRLHVDWHKRISSLKDDMARDSSSELFQSYTRPVIIYFEEMFKITQQCESQADNVFFMRHKPTIQKVIQMMKASQTVEELLKAYSELSKWVNSLNATAEPKTLISIISPTLDKFEFQNSDFQLTLPGFPASVSVVRVEPHVHVLATKTRPKRLTFRGSDGKSYSYLVKGTENLNVDSGVMQFMDIAEHLVQWPARSYSVTPLGKKGGLIQLVPNTTPLFYLYKKYLQKNGIDDRTTDIFWSRMNALGHSDRSSSSALRQVFDQLLKETSSDILGKELLLTARNPKAWYNCVHTLTGDCAMGSAIGYALGIGDRHLDNILVDLKSGYFIHVDFSLVFGKGATLRVPEKVPFRLTQNICSALKYPGQFGSFMIQLEKFLVTMKEQPEVILYAVQAIAGAHGIVDDLPVNPLPILEAELNSAATILKSRQKSIQRPGAVLKTDLLDMCKELDATKLDAVAMEAKLAACIKDIENLTIALGIINEKKCDSEKLKHLRDKCEFAVKRREVLNSVTALKEKLKQGILNLQDALSNRDALSRQTDQNWEVLHEIKRNLSSSRNNKAWFDVVVLFQDAIELADITLTFSWVSLRHPITCHPIARVVEAIEDVSERNLKVKPMTGCHTSKTAKAVWMLLHQDLTKTEDQIEQLRSILNAQGMSDVEAEIQGTELRCSSTEETLSRYTQTGDGATSDMEMFLKFAVPCLQRALAEMPVVYDFVVKILILCQNASDFVIPPETYGVLESLLNLHVKARDDLSLFVDGHFEPLLQDGFKVISSVTTVLEALKDGEMSSDYPFSRDKLMERWRAAVVEFEENMTNFKSWLTGADVSKFDITSDIVTNLLAPISNFTLPLTQECQSQIVRRGQQLVGMFYHYCRAPASQDDPLAVLLEEFKTLETRIRFLKDLHHSLDGCESAALFLSTEKDRFEWAFQNYLQKKIAPSEKRWEDGLNSIAELLEDFSTKWLQLDDNNEYLNGTKSLQEFQYPNLLPEMFAYMRSVYKFVTAVVTFESNRFNGIFVAEYNEIKKQLASLEKKHAVVMGSGELSVPETFLVNHTEAMNAKMQPPRSGAGDRSWAGMVEKLVTSQLQSEMQKKKQIADSIAKSAKSDKLIATRMTRIVNRWRRVLANLHPTIMFIHKYAKTTEDIKVYKMTIDNDWLPRVAQFWLFRSEEEQLTDPNALHEAFDFSEGTLRVLVDALEDAEMLEINEDMIGQYATVLCSSSNLRAYTEDKLNSFNKTVTAESLIGEATRPETLAKMYEGWSAWV